MTNIWTNQRLDYWFAVIVEIVNHIAEIVIPIGIPSKEAKAEIERLPVTTEDKIRKSLV